MRIIAGKTILERVIARIGTQCDGLILNANGDPARFAKFDLPVIAVALWTFPALSPAFSLGSTGWLRAVAVVSMYRS